MILDLEKVREFSGLITLEHLKNVDYYLGENVALLIPHNNVFDYSLEPHSLPSYLFWFLYHSESNVYVEDKYLKLEEGKIYGISPDIPHYEVIEDMQTRYYAINIKPSYFDKVYKAYTGQEPPIYKGDSRPLPEDLVAYLHEYIKTFDGQKTEDGEVRKALETLIAHKIIKSLADQVDSDKLMTPREELNVAVTYMQIHYKEKIQLETLVDLSGLSKAQFLKVFKAEIGMTPMAYLNKIRLERSKDFLNLGKTIKEVALLCGFKTPSYFIKQFRMAYDMTPKEYSKSRKSSFSGGDTEKYYKRYEIEKSIHYMFHYMDRKISVEDLAEDAAMSVTHYSRMFKEEMRTSPMIYLNQIRLERAKQFLSYEDKSILKISIECGFSSASYFSQCFKKAYGVTPVKYRKSLKIKKTPSES